MPNLLHLDTDATDTLRLQLRQRADDLYDRAVRLYAVLALAGWEGRSREELLDDLYRTTAALKQQAEQLDQLAFQLQIETEQWLANASALHS
jgi:hypothetical protein